MLFDYTPSCPKINRWPRRENVAVPRLSKALQSRSAAFGKFINPTLNSGQATRRVPWPPKRFWVSFCYEIPRRFHALTCIGGRDEKPQNIMPHTIRLGADLWRQYTIRFAPQHNEVAVRIGPVVNTGPVPLPGSEGANLPSSEVGANPCGRPPENPCGRPPENPCGHPPGEVQIKVGIPMAPTYDAENKVDIFSGPSFKFERRDDQLHVHFLDWHRRWSHSLTLAAALGLLGWLVFGKWGGLVIGLGFAGHVLEDQLGFMGSNLFYPFTKKRTTGLQLLRSGDAVPNFLTV